MQRNVQTSAETRNRHRHWHDLKRQAKRAGRTLPANHPARPVPRTAAHAAVRRSPAAIYIVLPPPEPVAGVAALEAAGALPAPELIVGARWKQHRRFLREAGGDAGWVTALRRKEVPRSRPPAPATVSAAESAPAWSGGVAFQTLEALDVLLAENPTPDDLERMRAAGAEVLQDTTVSLVHPVATARAAGGTPAAADWHLQAINAQAAWKQDLFGQGITVGVLDTGIAANHSEFAGVPIDYRAFGVQIPAKQVEKPRDYAEHGTHVCGIIAGKVAGLAKRASLKVAAVLTRRDAQGRPTGDLSEMLAGLNWLASSGGKGPANVVNASLTFSGTYKPLETKILGLRTNNQTLVLGAIGNEAAKGSQTQSPGNYGSVVGVGATDASGAVAPFSESKGGKPDLCAPGVNVLSAVPDGMARMSGTSMATPLATATAALLIQKEEKYTSNLDALAARLLQLVRPCVPATSSGIGTLDITGI